MNMLCATNYKLTPPTPAINLCFQGSHTTMPCYFNSLTGIFSVYGLGGRDLCIFSRYILLHETEEARNRANGNIFKNINLDQITLTERLPLHSNDPKKIISPLKYAKYICGNVLY